MVRLLRRKLQDKPFHPTSSKSREVNAVIDYRSMCSMPSSGDPLDRYRVPPGEIKLETGKNHGENGLRRQNNTLLQGEWHKHGSGQEFDELRSPKIQAVRRPSIARVFDHLSECQDGRFSSPLRKNRYVWFFLWIYFFSMKGSSIVLVASCLIHTIFSSPFSLLDGGNAGDPLDDFLYSTPIGDITDDELASDSFNAGSVIEASLERYPTVWQDWSSPDLDVSLQPSDTYESDRFATSPGNPFPHHLRPLCSREKMISRWTVRTPAVWARNHCVANPPRHYWRTSWQAGQCLVVIWVYLLFLIQSSSFLKLSSLNSRPELSSTLDAYRVWHDIAFLVLLDI